MKIYELKENEYFTIKDCNSNRLLAMGFVPNTKVKIYKKYSNIVCCYLRGAIIALRKSDCDEIEI